MNVEAHRRETVCKGQEMMRGRIHQRDRVGRRSKMEGEGYNLRIEIQRQRERETPIEQDQREERSRESS